MIKYLSKVYMRKLILLAITFLLSCIYANHSAAQKLFHESTLYSDSIFLDSWINSKYGIHIQKYEPQRLQAKNSSVDHTTGWQHLSYELTYKNIPLEFCQIKVHKKDGVIVSINGAYYDDVDVNTIPTISENSARNTAVSYINADVYSWQLDSLEHFDLIDAPQLKELPQGELVICPITMNYTTDSLTLAYKFSIYAITPESYKDIYVDAHSNKVLFSLSKMSSVMGVADTRFSGVQSIETTHKNNMYYLFDSTRCGGKISILTYDLHGSESHTSSTVTPITDTDNYWSAEEYHSSKDDAALDVHWGAGITLDYFYETFGRIGYNGKNSIKNYVNRQRNNASWTSAHVFKYGYGDNVYNPLVAIDVVAHEIGHAITDYEGNMISKNESGAINEGISDIWGACVSHYIDLDKDIWRIGEECCMTDSAFRYMHNPKIGKQPNTYQGQYWHDYIINTNDAGGIHTNSSLMSYWFYLITEGGEGVNDNNYQYNVTGIGFRKSEQIVYKALCDYFTRKIDYTMAAILTREAAIELFGFCSEEVETVINAWKAIGITIDLSIPQSLHITETISTDSVLIYRAVDTITSTNIILEGCNVTYQSTNLIYLQDGFHVKNGATFRAIIEPCFSSDQRISQRVKRKQNINSEKQQNSLIQMKNKIEVYPNPCNEVLFIRNIPSDIYSYQIFDIQGRLIKTEHINQTDITLETKELPSNVYVICLCAKGETIYLKFIKQY